MTKPLARKLGVEAGMRALFVDAPAEAVEAIAPPKLDAASPAGDRLEYIHLFTKSRTELEETLPGLRDRLDETGMLWVSWPKGRRLDTDLTLPEVIRIGYDHGLVESKCVSVDATWSALKFTFPKPGKVYRNSYGELRTPAWTDPGH